MKTLFLILDHGRERKSDRYVNEIIVGDDGVPVKDRYLFHATEAAEGHGCSKWFEGPTSTRSLAFVREKSHQWLACKGKVKTFLELSEWPTDEVR